MVHVVEIKSGHTQTLRHTEPDNDINDTQARWVNWFERRYYYYYYNNIKRQYWGPAEEQTDRQTVCVYVGRELFERVVCKLWARLDTEVAGWRERRLLKSLQLQTSAIKAPDKEILSSERVFMPVSGPVTASHSQSQPVSLPVAVSHTGHYTTLFYDVIT